MSGDGGPLLACERVCKSYPGLVPVDALRSVSFLVTAGEQVAVCGPSGSGKSTLMNILGLLDVPSEGSYSLMGVDASGMSEVERAGLRAESVGFVFQSFHLLGARTTLENVELGLTYVGLRPRRRRALARDVLGRVGLSQRAEARVETLSGGERQRVAIARAVAHGPDLVLADEPTGNLDSATSEKVMELLGELSRDDGLTQVIVTHNEALAASLPRRLDVLDGVVSDSAASKAPAE